MLEIIQYLHKNQSVLSLLKEGKISLLNVNPLENRFILEAFELKEKPAKKDPYLLYWHA